MARNKLYAILSSACAAGYIWILLTYHRHELALAPSVCIFKQVTGIPCPSCGSTRSVLSFLDGDFFNALIWNPFGIIIILFLLITPFWLLFDLLKKTDSLYHFYYRTEQVLKQKWVAIPLIVLVILNWIWNIYKGL